MPIVSKNDEDILLPAVRDLLLKCTKHKTMYGREIVKWCNENLELEANLTEAKLRNIINKLRQQELPVLANSQGYWISWDVEEITEVIISLLNRASAINLAKTGLVNCLNQIQIQKKLNNP